MLVSIGVLEEDGATNVKQFKGGSNIFSRLIKDASSTELDFREKEDSQSS